MSLWERCKYAFVMMIIGVGVIALLGMFTPAIPVVEWMLSGLVYPPLFVVGLVIAPFVASKIKVSRW